MADVERRFTQVPVELRAGKQRSIGGYAAKFEKQSRNLGGFVEELDPAFFNKSRGDGWPEVMARYNHDDNMLLGTTAAGTLRLSIDSVGLAYEVDPPASRSDIVELVERGDVRKSSFAFRTMEDDWGLTDQGFPLRRLMSGQLVDVAPVNSPAYWDTSVGARSADPEQVAHMRRLGLGPDAALRSLAVKFSADLDEVRKLATANELRKFFARSDVDGGKPRQTYGAAARMALLARKADPYT